MDSVEVVSPLAPVRRAAGPQRSSAAVIVLVVVAIIALAVLSSSLADAALKAGVVFAIWLSLSECSHGRTAPAAGPARPLPREGFELPGVPPPYPVYAPARRVRRTDRQPALARPGRYPGAIDFDEYDSDPAAGGQRDSRAEDSRRAPEGNPFNPGRVGVTLASGPCLDDEANDDEIGGDERMAYRGTARNDPTRATAGSMNRRRDLAKYLDEEVAEAEERMWWGRHEV